MPAKPTQLQGIGVYRGSLRVKTQEGNGVVSLECDILRRVNFACAQNDVAIVRRVSVHNETDRQIEGIRVSMRATIPIIREAVWTFDRIAPQSQIEVSPASLAKVRLDPERLAGLNEAEFGALVFHVAGGSQTFAPFERREPITLLARDEWGGLGYHPPQLLAAHVSPNEPAIAKLLKHASSLLEAAGHDGSLDGYRSGDPAKAYMMVAAIW